MTKTSNGGCPRGVVASVVFLALCGCTTVTRARTLPKGKLSLTGALMGGPDLSSPPPFYLDTILGLSYGITDHVEVSGQISAGGITARTKLGLVRAPSEEVGIDLTLAPAVEYGAWSIDLQGVARSVTFEFPILLGINFGHGKALVLAPQGAVTTWPGPSPACFVGGSIGLSFVVGPHVSVMPQVTTLVRLAALHAADSLDSRILPTAGVAVFVDP